MLCFLVHLTLFGRVAALPADLLHGQGGLRPLHHPRYHPMHPSSPLAAGDENQKRRGSCHRVCVALCGVGAGGGTMIRGRTECPPPPIGGGVLARQSRLSRARLGYIYTPGPEYFNLGQVGCREDVHMLVASSTRAIASPTPRQRSSTLGTPRTGCWTASRARDERT